MLVFLDLETTGLDPNKHTVLEVAAIATDDALVEVDRFESVVATDHEFHQLDKFIRDMHTKNGLWAAVQDAHYHNDRLDCVDHTLAEFIRKFVRFGKDDKGRTTIDRPQLAGNTISFDRAFLKRHLPNAEAELHYRNVDVSSLNEVFRRFNPKLHEQRPRNPDAAHRAMADAEESLRVCRYYAEKIGSIVVADPVP